MESFELPKSVRTASYRKPVENGLFIDTSKVDLGYVTAGCVGKVTGYDKLKFQVVKGDVCYDYDLQLNPTQYPINMGSGTYTFRIMERVEGNSYAKVSGYTKDVHLRSTTIPYTVPNVYCNYNPNGFCAVMAFSLCLNCKTTKAAYEAIVKWVCSTVTYDHAKADSLVKSKGYIPSPEATLKECKGVCFDYASLTAALLRCVGIPCKVVTGWIDGGYYHAWVSAFVDGKWRRCDPTMMAAGKKCKEYKVRFVY